MRHQVDTIREALNMSRAVWRSICREDVVDIIDDAIQSLDAIEELIGTQPSDPDAHLSGEAYLEAKQERAKDTDFTDIDP